MTSEQVKSTPLGEMSHEEFDEWVDDMWGKETDAEKAEWAAQGGTGYFPFREWLFGEWFERRREKQGDPVREVWDEIPF